MKDTKKEVKKLIIDVLDEHALSEFNIKRKYGFIYLFDRIERDRKNYIKAKQDYDEFVNSPYYEGEPKIEDMRLKVAGAEYGYHQDLEELYACIIGETKFGEWAEEAFEKLKN